MIEALPRPQLPPLALAQKVFATSAPRGSGLRVVPRYLPAFTKGTILPHCSAGEGETVEIGGEGCLGYHPWPVDWNEICPAVPSKLSRLAGALPLFDAYRGDPNVELEIRDTHVTITCAFSNALSKVGLVAELQNRCRAVAPSVKESGGSSLTVRGSKWGFLEKGGRGATSWRGAYSE